MQTSTAPSSNPGNSTERGSHSADTSFAGLLASMATPPKPETAWNDSELAEDVATISYEQALRTHARSVAKTSDAAVEPASNETSSGASAAKPSRTASITIRLSEAEGAQLRQRAAESGLTVSAYLRSCTLEVESLRAQVKDALAQLRAPKPAAPEADSQADGNGGVQGMLARLRHWFRPLGASRRPAFRLNPGNPFAPVR